MKTPIVSMLLKRPSPVSVLQRAQSAKLAEFARLAWHESYKPHRAVEVVPVNDNPT